MDAGCRALMDQMQNIQGMLLNQAVLVLKLLERGLDEPLDGAAAEGVLSGSLSGLAGMTHGGGTDWTDLKDLVPEVYGYEPWKYGLFVNEALLDLADAVSYDPHTLNVVFHVAERAVEMLAESRARGSCAYPQGERLLDRAIEVGTQYLRYLASAEVEEERKFLSVIKPWLSHADETIRTMAAACQSNYKP